MVTMITEKEYKEFETLFIKEQIEQEIKLWKENYMQNIIKELDK